MPSMHRSSNCIANRNRRALGDECHDGETGSTLKPGSPLQRVCAARGPSSRLFELNGEATRVSKSQIRAIIPADVRRISPDILLFSRWPHRAEEAARGPAFRQSSDPRSHQGNDDLRQDDQCRDDERGAPFSLVYESLHDKRQHGGIGELKQEQAGGKGEQPGTLPEASAACPRGLTRHVVMGRPAGAAEVDVGCTDPSQRNKQRKDECGDCQEYRLVRQDISDQAHERGRDEVSRRGEALIAPEPFRQGRMANQAEANRNDRRPEKPAR